MTTRYIVHQATHIDNNSEWHLHTEACKDNRTAKYRYDDLNYIIEADSGKAARSEFIDDEMIEMGWGEDAVYLAPCARER